MKSKETPCRRADRLFVAGLLGAILLGAGLLLSLCCSLGHQTPSNVLLITLDTTRADHLGCYGYAGAHTPTLDSLAAAGARFTEAVTPVPLTAPAHSSILTGLNPCRHGVRDNGAFALSPNVPDVAEQFRTQGYQTAAFVSSFVLTRQFGLNRGFSVYDDHLYNERRGRRTTEAALRWFGKIDPHKPFFVWVHYYDAHTPYQPMEPFRSLKLPTAYDQEVAEEDAALGTLLAGLRARGLLNRTLVVTAADHGEGLGDHGEDEHGLFLYDETVRVPLIVNLPGAPRGRVINGSVSLIDLAPTMLEAAGLPPLAGAEGQSLVGLLHAGKWSPRRAEYSETYYPEFGCGCSALKSLRSPRWKYIRAPRSELYDLQGDPKESANLLGTRPDSGQVFADRLDRYLASLPALPSGATSLSAEDAERLHSLGYLSGDEPAVESREALPDPKDMLAVLSAFAKAKEAAYARHWEEARRNFLLVLSGNPENVVASRELGKALMHLHRYDEAAEVLQAAWKKSPHNSSITRNLGEAYLRAGRPDLALEPYRAAAADPLHHWPAVLGVVGALLDLGRMEEAKSYVTGEIAKSGDGGQAVADAQGLADAKLLLQQVDRYSACRSALRRSPVDDLLRLNLAGAAFDLGLMKEARQVLQFHPPDARTEGNRQRILGSIAGVEDDSVAALAAFERAKVGLPNDPYVYLHLVDLYLQFGRPRDALLAAESATRLGRPSANLLYNEACAHAKLGQFDAGLYALEEAVRLGYANASKMLEDPDLAPLQNHPRFQKLAGDAALK